MNKSVGASFSLPSSSSSTGLVLEQDEWEDGVGVVTREYIVKHIAALLGFGDTPPTIDCGVNSLGYYESVVTAYPYDANLVYDIDISHGFIAAKPIVLTIQKTDLVDFSNSKTQALEYPFHGAVSLVWLQGPFDSEGNDAPKTDLSYSESNVTTTTNVYGTAKVIYKTIAHRYSVTVPARDSVENKYQSVVWARWDGGYKYEVLTAPDNAEEAAENDTSCYDIVKITPSDNFTAPYADGSDESQEVDYCSQTII